MGAKWTKFGATHPKIRRLYREYNRKYFRGALPPRAKILMALNWPLDRWGRCERDENGRFTIILNNKLCSLERAFRWTMLHEMAHIPTMKESDDHGPKWRKEMRRLARVGAFEDVW